MRGSAAAENQAILDQLLGPDQIRIALQPIYSADREVRLGAEALMRGPEGMPYESPVLAFSMADTLGMLERLDCHCIMKASAAPEEGLLFINVHPRTLSERDFWSAVAHLTTSSQRRPEDIVFEIVEHAPAHESDLPKALAELRASGFQIAVDDLGEGTAGFRRLIEVGPDFAKIDHFFVRGLENDRRRRAVVAAVLGIGRDLGVKIIAEGVETEAELAVLRDMGVEWVQGYLIGRPTICQMPPEADSSNTSGREGHA